MSHVCGMCGGGNTIYAAFSGGCEYYCYDCQDNASYDLGDAPRRVQMLADGRFYELRVEMREELERRK